MACDLLPHLAPENHCTAKTCAQMASIPMNNASDVSAAASSTTARTMTPFLPDWTERERCSIFVPKSRLGTGLPKATSSGQAMLADARP
jgi:hypothetical protein